MAAHCGTIISLVPLFYICSWIIPSKCTLPFFPTIGTCVLFKTTATVVRAIYCSLKTTNNGLLFCDV